MDTPEQRLQKVIHAMQSLVQWQNERDQLKFLPAEGEDSLAKLERDFNRLLLKIRDGETEARIATSNLAIDNGRLAMWKEMVQRINITDSVLYHGDDIQIFFHQIVVDAMQIARARYGAIAIFDKNGNIAQFISEGLSAEHIARIGHLPLGKGLLGAACCSSKPEMVDNIAADSRSCGFPPGHPPMKTLIVVPLRAGDILKGVIYLAEKQFGTVFGEDDERLFATCFDEDDEGLLTLFGDYLARTMERLDLMSLLQKEKSEQQELIEKLNNTQNQLLQSEKMASIGQLAAGVAHEINNPVGFVNSNLGTLQRYIADLFTALSAYELHEGEMTAETRAVLTELKRKIDLVYLREDVGNLLTESMEGLQRVKRIVQDLKDFSHVDESEKQPANLEQGLDSTLNVVWNELKYKAEVVKEYGGVPEIECIPSQLNQVFMNLLMNAAQAIETHGKITIRTGQDGDNVWVEVEDTGKGIKPEHLERIFDPFFTTKPVGSGTGLGLSLSYGIVQKHGGFIEVKSKLGKGTVFRVVLPQHAVPSGSAPLATLSPLAGERSKNCELQDERRF